MQKVDWFDKWFGTRYYTMLYGNRNNAEAKPLVNSILQTLNLKAESKVWDMACGRGRHLYWFNEAGMDAYGSDLSEQSIVEAGLNVPNAHFKVHDMRLGPAYEHVDLCLNLFTSMGYFETEQGDIDVLTSAVSAMKPKSYFVLDFLNAETVAKQLVPISTKQIGEVSFTSKRDIKDGFIQKHIKVVDGEDVYEFQEKVRAYTIGNLSEMIASVGLKVLSIHGKDMLEPVENSSRCVVIAQKP